MNDRIILQSVRREPAALKMLVEQSATGWKLLTAETPPPDLPVETALYTAEAIFGGGSVCSLWKLGEAEESGIRYHIFCLDSESLDEVQPAKIAANELIWIDQEAFFRELTRFQIPLAKIKQLVPSNT